MINKNNCRLVTKGNGRNFILFTDKSQANVRGVNHIIIIPRELKYKLKIDICFMILFSTRLESLEKYVILFDEFGIYDVITRLRQSNSQIYNQLFKSGKLKFVCGRKRIE